MAAHRISVLCNNVRYFSTVSSNRARALIYEGHGNPEDVISLQEVPPIERGVNDIEIEMLMAPVNPSDINQIQGTYPMKPSLPAVGGNEGVGVVRRCGQNVSALSEGDLVIPLLPGTGTWCTSLVSRADLFLKLPTNNVSIDFAATLQVNPPTAYRMLRDFIPLSKDDCIIQNGANSGVGQAVIQLANAWGIKTINIIRSRPDGTQNDVVDYLKGLGANEVITEEYLSSHEIKELMKGYPQPKLALNCVGGKSSTGLLRHLSNGGTMITYGGMSRQPVTIPTGLLIFKEIKCVGYWNGLWLTRNINTKRSLVEEMYSELCTLAINGQLRAPKCVHYKIEDFKTALTNAMKPYISSKQLLILNN